MGMWRVYLRKIRPSDSRGPTHLKSDSRLYTVSLYSVHICSWTVSVVAWNHLVLLNPTAANTTPEVDMPTRFMVASGRELSEGYGHGGPGVCLGDGQTEAEGVPSQGGRGDALL